MLGKRSLLSFSGFDLFSGATANCSFQRGYIPQMFSHSLIPFLDETTIGPRGYNSTCRGYNPSYPFIRPFIEV